MRRTIGLVIGSDKEAGTVEALIRVRRRRTSSKGRHVDVNKGSHNPRDFIE
jgi:hypothetical protein